MPTLVYATGFEHGAALVAGVGNGLCLSKQGTGTDTITASAARASHSAFGMRLVTDNVNNWREINLYNVNGTTLVGSFYWRAVDKPTTNEKDVFYCPIGAGAGFILINYSPSTNMLASHIFGTSNVGQSAFTTVTTNQWYRIDFKISTGTATWAIDWKIDGVDQTSTTLGSQTAGALIGDFILDANATGTDDPHGCTWDYDDVVLSVTGTDFPLGQYAVVGITADQTAAAAHQTITTTEWQYGTLSGATFTSTGNFTGNNETDSRSRLNGLFTTKGIRMNAGNTGQAGNARWPVADPTKPTGGTVQAVSLITASQEAAAGTNSATFRTLVGASTTNHFNADPGWGTTINYLRSIMTTKPGGGAWADADVQGINFEADSGDSNPAIHLTGFYYEVAYSIAASAAKSLAVHSRTSRNTLLRR